MGATKWQRFLPAPRRAAILAVFVSIVTGCGLSGKRAVPELEPDVPQPAPDAGSRFAGAHRIQTIVTVTSVLPDTGPFTGGNIVLVRGSGFTPNAIVRFGSHVAQLGDTIFEDVNTLSVVVPAGELGPVDVQVSVGTSVATRVDGYTYNGVSIDPPRGSAAGGTIVRMTTMGADLTDGVTVSIGAGPCEPVEIISPTLLSCTTPAGVVGRADVVVTWPADELSIEAAGAFEYIDPGDAFKGGLAGGPIDGSVNLTLIETVLGIKLPDAEVWLVRQDGTTLKGTTDAEGQATLSAEGLTGRVSLHVFRECFESESILDFDAQNVTLYTRITAEPVCAPVYCVILGGSPLCCDPATFDPDDCAGEPPALPPPPVGRGVAGSVISGELIFPGDEEFGVNPWENVPPPRPGEVRVTYVYSTRRTLFSSDVNPAQNGLQARVEELTSPFGTRGYPYSIFARPAGLAVYALAGLEDAQGYFVPYVMGVTRDVLTSPSQETSGVNIWMGIPLDHAMRVSLTDLPAKTPRGPLEYRVQAHIDLGGEGIIARRINGELFDAVAQFSTESLFELYAQPALNGTLLGAPYVLYAGWYSGISRPLPAAQQFPDPPYTEQVVPGVQRTDQPSVLGGFLAIPEQVRPPPGGRIPEDQTLAWKLDGNAPDLLVARIQSSGGTPLWRIIMPGSRREMHLPRLDLLPLGLLTWRMHASNVKGFDYDRFNYDYFSSRLWTHEALDDLLIQR